MQQNIVAERETMLRKKKKTQEKREKKNVPESPCPYSKSDMSPNMSYALCQTPSTRCRDSKIRPCKCVFVWAVISLGVAIMLRPP